MSIPNLTVNSQTSKKKYYDLATTNIIPNILAKYQGKTFTLNF